MTGHLVETFFLNPEVRICVNTNLLCRFILRRDQIGPRRKLECRTTGTSR